MSLHIEINNQYVITCDRYQFILQERKTATSGKNKGRDWLDVVGYYPKSLSLSQAWYCMTF